MSWRVVKEISRDRTAFRVPGLGVFDESNRHGDGLDFYRDDYSIFMFGDGSGDAPALDLAAGVRPAWAEKVAYATGGPAMTGKVVYAN